MQSYGEPAPATEPVGAPPGLRIAGESPFEIGRSAALGHGAGIRRTVYMLSRMCRRVPSLGERAIAEGRRLQSCAGEREDGLSAELEGLSRGLGVSRSDLWCARSALESLAAPFCTNFGAESPATEDDKVMLSWNFDAPVILRWLMGGFPFFVRNLKGTLPYLCLGVPSLFGIGILNSEGLCCVVNAVGIQDDGDGMSPFELNNLVMENSSAVAEAEGIFKRGPRQATRAMLVGMLMNWNMIWGDRNRGLSVFEYSHNHFHRERATREGVIASANHHQFLDRSLSGSFDPTTQELIAGSYSRLARMWSLLERFRGAIGPQAAKQITSDHIPDYSLLADFGIKGEWWEEKQDDSTISAHAWNLKAHLLSGDFGAAIRELGISTTLYSIQVQPGDMTVWFTRGHPCRNPTVPVYWGRLLGADITRKMDALPPGSAGRERVAAAPKGIFRKDAGPLERSLARAWYGIIGSIESGSFRKAEGATRR